MSDRPEHALYPSPTNSAGWKLWKMLNERTGAFRRDYLRAFDRRNLLCARTWKKVDAKVAAGSFLTKECTRIEAGTTIVVLGEETRATLELPKLLILPQTHMGLIWRQLPHPSGRNLWYNDKSNRAVAALLLEELYETHRTGG